MFFCFRIDLFENKKKIIKLHFSVIQLDNFNNMLLTSPETYLGIIPTHSLSTDAIRSIQK